MAGYQWLAKEGGHPNAAVPPETPAGDAELILKAGAAASPAVRLPVR